MGALQHNLGTYTLLARTLHREKKGGYEIWQFTIDDKKYIFFSDIRYLYEIDERVIIVDFFSEETQETLDPFSLTHTSNYHARKVIGCINELTTRTLPPLRKYRYVALPGGPEWAGIHKRLISRLGTPASDEIVEFTKKRLNYELNIEIDAGYCHCEVGDLITNTDFITAGLDKKENRLEVNLEPVSLIN
jgi:hypothetical protein